jgi:membrane-associated protease RseP (regulator of RpoE activity)
MVRKILCVSLGLVLVGAIAFAKGDRDKEGEGPHIYVDEVDLGPASEWTDYGFGADWREEEGLLIVGVMEDSPAEKAGLARGDVLLALDDREVSSVAEVRELLAEHQAGDTVRLRIRHGDEEETVEVTLEQRLYRAPLGVQLAAPLRGEWGSDVPGMEGPHFRGPGWGPGWDRWFFGPLMEGGVAVVREVTEDSPADQAGLKKGDVIVTADGEDLSAPDSLTDIVKSREPGDGIVLTYRRYEDGEMREMEASVTLAEGEDGNALLGIRYTSLPGVRVFERFSGPRGRMERLDLIVRPRMRISIVGEDTVSEPESI